MAAMQHPECTVPPEECRITTTSYTTAVAWTPVYDGSGALVNKDPNAATTTYSCATCARAWQMQGDDPATLANLPSTSVPPIVIDVPYMGAQDPEHPELLSCTMGNWAGEPVRYAWQWVRDGNTHVVGSGDAGDQYVTTEADVGHTLTCIVTATNSHGSTAAPPSNPCMVMPPPDQLGVPAGHTPAARNRDMYGQYAKEEAAPAREA
jgi:hypothetical protein